MMTANDSTASLSEILVEGRDQLSSIGDFIRWGASLFNEYELHFGHGTDNAWDEAENLIAHALHLSPPIANEWLIARLTKTEKIKITDFFSARIENKIPAAYLTGKAWFAGLLFQVDARVLVPRSPIAELIQQKFSPHLRGEPAQILDLCTGSGCIGIACAYAFPNAEVQLSDISYDALSVAEENIQAHHLSDRVFAMQSDCFENLHGQQFDLIVSNPPYVDAEDMASLPDEYHAEPELGLASGGDGLDFTRRLLQEAKKYLTESGVLIVEVGNSMIALQNKFPELPFQWIEFERGGHGVFVLHAKDLK